MTHVSTDRMIPPMNGLTIYALGTELDTLLRGARIAEVLAFPGGATIRLEESACAFLHLLHHGRERALFTGDRPIVNDRHCRECLKGAKRADISSVRPLGMDRVLLIGLERPGGLGKDASLLLRIDFLPFNPPAVLYRGSDGRRLESFGPARTRPAAEETPSPKRLSLLSLPEDPPSDLALLQGSPAGVPEQTAALSRARHAADWLIETIGGIDPVTARQTTRAAGGDSASIWRSIRSIGASAAVGNWSWRLYRIPGSAGKALYPLEMPFEAPFQSFSGLLPALDAAAREIYLPSFVAGLRKRVSAGAAGEIRRLEKLSANIAGDIARAERSREMRHFGNLLVTYRHLMKPGLERLSVKDFSGDREVTIPLDPARTPDQNIQRYFKQAKKGERGLLLLRNRRRAVERELTDTRGIAEEWNRITDPDALLSVLPPPPRPRQREEEQSRFRSFELDRHHTVLVGRTDRENDLLTHRIASPGDLWFHAQGSPGSHVILKGASPSTPKRIIEKAASVAAFFSKARHSTTVPVICAEKRYVRKPRKSKPGTAVCLRSRTLFVKPGLPEDPGDA